MHTNLTVTDERQYPVYLTEDGSLTNYLEANTRYTSFYDTDMIMKYSDYTALRAMLGYPEAEMESGQYLVHCMPYLENAVRQYSQSELYDTFVIYEKENLTLGNVYTETFNQYLWGGNGYNFILVLPDHIAEKYTIHGICYAAMTKEPISETQYYALRDIFIKQIPPMMAFLTQTSTAQSTPSHKRKEPKLPKWQCLLFRSTTWP